MITGEEQVPYPHYCKNYRAHMGCIAKIETCFSCPQEFFGII
jgi:hypothetical protein